MSNKTPHPHKSLIAEWLEDTRRIVEEEYSPGQWVPSRFNNDLDLASFESRFNMRLAPAKIKVGDRECVAPMRLAPEPGTKYWKLNLSGITEYRWVDDQQDTLWLAEGRCFENVDDCMAMRSALLELLK